jgi:hypothetical protein
LESERDLVRNTAHGLAAIGRLRRRLVRVDKDPVSNPIEVGVETERSLRDGEGDVRSKQFADGE